MHFCICATIVYIYIYFVHVCKIIEYWLQMKVSLLEELFFAPKVVSRLQICRFEFYASSKHFFSPSPCGDINFCEGIELVWFWSMCNFPVMVLSMHIICIVHYRSDWCNATTCAESRWISHRNFFVSKAAAQIILAQLHRTQHEQS